MPLLSTIKQNSIQLPPVKINAICRGITVDHQCGFRSNRSPTDHLFCINQLLEKKWEKM